MIVIQSKYLVPKGYSAWAVFPFIMARDEPGPVLLHHERIHLRQQLEMLLLPFFVWYVVEFLVRWLQGRNGVAAYRSISFEREAYAFESHPGYLKERKFWAFLEFLNPKHREL